MVHLPGEGFLTFAAEENHMNNFIQIWTDEYEVPWDALGAAGEASPDAIAVWMQESAWRHASRLGVGFEKLEKHRLAWVLMRSRINMFDFPRWGDHLKVETWPAGLDGLLALRNFRLSLVNGKTLGYASTSWLIIDAMTRRPQSPAQLKHIPVVQPVGLPAVNAPAKLIPAEPGETCQIKTVRYRDIDAHGHVNNSRYVSWMMDLLNLDWHRGFKISELTLNYLREAFEGDEISLSLNKIAENEMGTTGKRISDGKVVFCGSMKYQPRNP